MASFLTYLPKKKKKKTPLSAFIYGPEWLGYIRCCKRYDVATHGLATLKTFGPWKIDSPLHLGVCGDHSRNSSSANRVCLLQGLQR